jgi:hypothetical protein
MLYHVASIVNALIVSEKMNFSWEIDGEKVIGIEFT